MGKLNREKPRRSVMLTNDVKNEDSQVVDTEKIRDPEEIVFELYSAYEPLIDPHLWPWETKRWHELVFCLLTTIVEPEISPKTTREVTLALSELNLLEIDFLAKLDPAHNDRDTSNPILITIATILKQSNFDENQARIAVTAICEAASSLKQKYQGKVQEYFRKYGALMLNESEKDFSFTSLNQEDIKKALSIWLQNSLNMPVPASNPIADRVCEKLNIKYSKFVEVADKLDVNVALLDDALRAYWENVLEEEEFFPAEEES